MRHNVKHRKLKRTASHRRALLINLSISLILYKRIRTTVAKAKELRGFIEPLVSKARVGDLHRLRLVMDTLKHKDAVKELLSVVIPAVGDRPGGFTRVIKAGKRLGDAAEMAIIEFVDLNEVANTKATTLEQAKQDRKAAKEAGEVEDAKVVEEKAFDKK